MISFLTIDLTIAATDLVLELVTEVIAVVSVGPGHVGACAEVGHPDRGAVVLVGDA